LKTPKQKINSTQNEKRENEKMRNKKNTKTKTINIPKKYLLLFEI